MSIANEAVTFLAAAAVGTAATTLFADDLPPDPDECLSVTDYAAREPGYVLGQALPNLEYFRVQIQARGATKAAAKALARAAYLALAPVRNQTVGGEFWLKATPLQQPFRLRKDDKGRSVFAFNVEIEKRR